MKIKKRYKKSSRKHISSSKKLISIYVSLFLVVIIGVTATFSWFTAKNNSNISGEFSLQSANGLRVNDGEDLSNTIYLENITLDEASSVDGRNMYFPTKGTYSSDTAAMFFREGNAGDKNVKYWAKDFTLTADADGSEIYVQDYSIKVYQSDGKMPYKEFNGITKVEDKDKDGKLDYQEKGSDCPIRIAFIQDSSDTPNVIDPSALLPEYVDNYNAVKQTDSTGKPLSNGLEMQKAKPFSDFYFGVGDYPIFTLGASKSLTATMVVWLEGAAGDKLWAEYADKKITVEVDLESNFQDMKPVYFIDETIGDDGKTESGHWIGTDCLVVMTYIDRNGHTKTTKMKKVTNKNYTWVAYLPDEVTTNISFYRYSNNRDNEEVIYNSWHTKTGINKQLNNNPFNEDGVVNIVEDNNWVPKYGHLQESRLKSDNTVSDTYRAMRGNGFGEVHESTDAHTDYKRLSPCLGYWDGVDKPGGGTTTPTQPTTTPTPGGDTVNAYIAIDDNNRNAFDSVKYNRYKMYLVFESTKIDITEYIQNTSEYRLNNTQISVPKNEKLKGIQLYDSNGTLQQNYELSTPHDALQQNWYYTLTISRESTLTISP